MCSDAFCWQYPLPQANPLKAIAATSDETVWAVGEAGALLHGDHGVWRAVNASDSRTLRAVWALSDRDVWAVGDAGTIVHFDGTTWTRIPSGTTGTLCGIWGASKEHIWVVGDLKDPASGQLGALFYDGTSWSIRPIPADLSTCGIWGSGPNEVWMTVSRSGGEMLVHWDGKQWTKPDEHPSYVGLLGGTDVDDVWSVGRTTAYTYRKPKGETRWRSIGSPLPGRPAVSALQVNAPNDVWLAGIQTYHWDGASWATTDPDRGAVAMTTAPGSKQVWLADGHHVRRGGHADARSEMPSGVHAAWVSDDDRAMVLTRAQELLQFDGAAWNSVGSLPGKALVANMGGTLDGTAIVFFSDAKGGNETTRVYDGTWQTLSGRQPSDSGFGVYAGTSSRDIWLLGSEFHHYDGTAWTKVALPVAATGDRGFARALHASSKDNMWIVGHIDAFKGAYAARFDGTSWKAVPFPNSARIDLSAVWSSGPTDAWVAGELTKPDPQDPNDPGKHSFEPVVYRFDGSTWTKVAIPGIDGPKPDVLLEGVTLSGRGPNEVWLALDLTRSPERRATEVFVWNGSAWTARPAPIARPRRMWTTGSSTWIYGGVHLEGGLVRSNAAR